MFAIAGALEVQMFANIARLKQDMSLTRRSVKKAKKCVKRALRKTKR